MNHINIQTGDNYYTKYLKFLDEIRIIIEADYMIYFDKF